MSHNKIGSRTVCLDKEEGKEYTGGDEGGGKHQGFSLVQCGIVPENKAPAVNKLFTNQFLLGR